MHGNVVWVIAIGKNSNAPLHRFGPGSYRRKELGQNRIRSEPERFLGGAHKMVQIEVEAHLTSGDPEDMSAAIEGHQPRTTRDNEELRIIVPPPESQNLALRFAFLPC